MKERKEEKKKKKRKSKGMESMYGYMTLSMDCMDHYGFVWKPCFCMETRFLYGSVCMEISGSISRV